MPSTPPRTTMGRARAVRRVAWRHGACGAPTPLASRCGRPRPRPTVRRRGLDEAWMQRGTLGAPPAAQRQRRKRARLLAGRVCMHWRPAVSCGRCSWAWRSAAAATGPADLAAAAAGPYAGRQQVEACVGGRGEKGVCKTRAHLGRIWASLEVPISGIAGRAHCVIRATGRRCRA